MTMSNIKKIPMYFGKSLISIIFRGRIQKGLFASMKWSEKSFGGWFPKIFGSYEFKIQEHLETLLVEKPNPVVFDIGAAEGFYAVGLATCGATVVAWEGEEVVRDELIKVAERNNVKDLVEVRGYCESDELVTLIKERGAPDILIMDTEGYETKLITEELLKICQSTKFIIELHGDDAIRHVSDTFGRAAIPGKLFDHSAFEVTEWPHYEWITNTIKKFLLEERRVPGGNPYFLSAQ